MKAEFYALKLFFMEEVYNIDKNIDRLRMECDHMHCKNDSRAKPQTKNKTFKIFINTANPSYACHKANSN